MRLRVICGAFSLALLLLAGGCSNSSQADKVPPMEIQGVNVDFPQLSADFAKSQPDLQSRVAEVVTKVRYKRYLPAMMDLDEIAKSPGLTNKQKKLVAQVMDQLKEVMSKDQGNP
jgi:cell pole-organizing protein PopZ